LASKNIKDKDSAEELINAFKVFDEENKVQKRFYIRLYNRDG